MSIKEICLIVIATSLVLITIAVVGSAWAENQGCAYYMPQSDYPKMQSN